MDGDLWWFALKSPHTMAKGEKQKEKSARERERERDKKKVIRKQATALKL